MGIARVEGGAVLERRDMELSAVPEHKRSLWRPIVYEGDGPIEQTIIEAEQVRIVRSRPAPTVNDVAAERNRRLSLGFNYDFGDSRGVHHIGTTGADMIGWGEVSTYAGALIDSGDVETAIAIATNTGLCQVTAPEWRAIEIAAAAFRQPLWAASFALMAQSPIPEDYTNDVYWT